MPLVVVEMTADRRPPFVLSIAEGTADALRATADRQPFVPLRAGRPTADSLMDGGRRRCPEPVEGSAVGGQHNLLANPGFEAGTMGWQVVPSTATFRVVDTPVHSGARAASITKETAKGRVLIYQEVPIAAGDCYAAQVWAVWNDPQLSNVKLRVGWYDERGQRLWRDEVALEGRSPEYQHLVLEGLEVPSGAVWARIEGYAYVNRAAPAQPALFDDFRFVQVSDPTPGTTPSPTLAPSVTPTPRPARPGDVLINEVFYDPPAPGGEPGHEWIELYNATAQPVNLAGWVLADHIGEDVLPPLELPAAAFLVVAASVAFRTNYPDYDGLLIVLDGAIGNGLANTGDALWLRDPRGTIIDAMSYGTDTAGLNPAVPLAPAGYSLERVPMGQDTDTAADWYPRQFPSPGWGVRLRWGYLPLVVRY